MSMRIFLVAALAAGCGAGASHGSSSVPDPGASQGSQPPPLGSVEVVGTISHHDDQGGFWVIVAGGVLYDPVTPLDAQWQKQGLPVRALLHPLYGVEAHVGALRADVLRLEQISCADLPCPPPGPAVTLVVMVDGGTGVAYQATLANARGPSLAAPAFDCVSGSDTPTSPVMRKCFIFGGAPGVYEADVTASGYQPNHVRIEVPAPTVTPGECCTRPYVPQAQWVVLVPVN